MHERTTQSELAAVLDTMVDGVIMIDKRGIVQRYNPACEVIFGYKKDEVIGHDVSMLMPDPDRAHHSTYISNYQTTRDAQIIGIGREVKGRRKDGTMFPMYLSVGEMPDAEANAFVGIIRDLTHENDQRTKFDELQQEHFHLSRVAAMDQMGAAIAHELNQPLTAIMNYLEAGVVLVDKTEIENAEKLKNTLTQSALQAERAAKILSRLRKFIETGTIEKRKEELGTIINTAVALIMPVYKNYKIDLKTSMPPALPQVQVRDVQIQQVLVNLLRNACEAMQDTSTKELTITAERHSEHYVKVGIVDTGVGLTDSQFEKLYEPFSSNKQGGLGVGLSISQSIVSAHDGQLWAERGSPDGCCFYFTIPVESE